MKKTLLAFFTVSFGTILISALTGGSTATSNSTGAPGSGSCTACHGGTLNSGPEVILEIYDTATKAEVTSYQAGKVYGITAGLKKNGIFKVGFALSKNIGTLSKVNGATRSQITSGYATHTSSGTAASNGEALWDVLWRAPATASTNAQFQLYVNNTNDNGASDPGDQVFFKTVSLDHMATGIETVIGYEGIHIFPQPAAGSINLRYNLVSAATVKISLFDLAGKKVLDAPEAAQQAGQQETKVDLSTLGKGIYLIHLNMNGETLTKKIMVN